MSVKISPTIVLEGLFSVTTMESAFAADLSMSYDNEGELFGVVDYNKSMWKLPFCKHQVPTILYSHFAISSQS